MDWFSYKGPGMEILWGVTLTEKRSVYLRNVRMVDLSREFTGLLKLILLQML